MGKLRSCCTEKKIRAYFLKRNTTKLYSRIDMTALEVVIYRRLLGQKCAIAIFRYENTLAKAVIQSRAFCQIFYPDASILEYNVC
jgi:hypothetical protein